MSGDDEAVEDIEGDFLNRYDENIRKTFAMIEFD